MRSKPNRDYRYYRYYCYYRYDRYDRHHRYDRCNRYDRYDCYKRKIDVRVTPMTCSGHYMLQTKRDYYTEGNGCDMDWMLRATGGAKRLP